MSSRFWIRAAQLRGVLLPLGVALIMIVALTLYGLVWIPAQQQYLNERNLRLLRTMGAQIKGKVDGFDQAIDHAIESFLPQELSEKDPAFQSILKKFPAQVRAFAPDLEVLEEPEEGSAERMIYDNPGDPPRVAIQRDEGRDYLYLAYKHNGRTVLARSDIGEVAAGYLSAGSVFDAVLLVNRGGQVIAQQSSSSLLLARVDTLISTARNGATAESEKPVDTFDTLRTSSNIRNISFGDAPYKLYIQPIQLSLSRALIRATPGAANESFEPEEWAVCGLVREDHFRAESSAISYTYLLEFSAALTALFLAIPLLKLQILNPQERLTRGDSVSVVVATFMLTGLFMFCVADAYFFGWEYRNITDSQLNQLANQLNLRLKKETADIWRQLNAFERDIDHLPQDASLQKDLKEDPARTLQLTCEQSRGDPNSFCREELLKKSPRRIQEWAYPYFARAIWYDINGWERVKWTTAAHITPFINITGTTLSGYYTDIRHDWLAGGGGQVKGVDVLRSPNTGDKVTIFWRELAKTAQPRKAGSRTVLIGASLSIPAPLSVGQTVLPKGQKFAVLDKSGSVLFHSEQTHSLEENFFEESENDPALSAAVRGRSDTTLTAYYQGRKHRLYVMPLQMESSGRRPWSLVTFQDTVIPETLNLETLTLAAVMFCLYSVVLGSLWAGAYLGWRRYPVRWFWPDHSRRAGYQIALLINMVCTVILLGGILVFRPVTLLIGTVLLAIGAILVTFRVVTHPPTATIDWDLLEREFPFAVIFFELARFILKRLRGWQREFCWARALLLVVVAAAPAFACFRVAYEFETRLLIKSGQMDLANQLEAREQRIKGETEKFALCDENDEGCGQAADFIKQRRMFPDVSTASFFETCQVGTDQLCGNPNASLNPLRGSLLDPLLALIHRSYNDVAVDLKAAIPDETPGNWYCSASNQFGPQVLAKTQLILAKTPEVPFLKSDLTPTTALPSPWCSLLAAVIAFSLYNLQRYTAKRLFALDLDVRPGSWPPDPAAEAANVLLIGPPGSGKTRRLNAVKMIRIFDARALGLPNILAQKARAAAASGAASGSSDSSQPGSLETDNWALRFDYSTLPEATVPIGIDHFEHRMNESGFREQMLHFLEELVYRRRRRVWIVTGIDPLSNLHESAAGDTTGLRAADFERWNRLLGTFWKEHVGIEGDENYESRLSATGATLEVRKIIADECMVAPQLRAIGEALAQRDAGLAKRSEEVLVEIGTAAESYYSSVWASCSRKQQLALRQLADEGIVNPRNQTVLRELARNGLIVYRPTFRIMNKTFQRFILQATPGKTIAEWEKEGVEISWGTFRTTVLTVVFGVAALLVLTQEQIVAAWIGSIPAVAPVIIKIFGSLRRDSKAEAPAA